SGVALLVAPPPPPNASKIVPVTVETIISSDPEVQGGAVVFTGTRVPLKNLIDYLEAGDSLEEFLEDFPSVTREQAVAALELAKEALSTLRSMRPGEVLTIRACR